MLNNYKRKCSTPAHFLYNVYKKNAGEVSKYNVTLAKKTYLKLPSNLKNSLQRTQW